MNIASVNSYGNLSSPSRYCSFSGKNTNDTKASNILDKTKNAAKTFISPKNHTEVKSTLTVLSVISGLGAAASLLAGQKQAWLGPLLGAFATIFIAKTAYDIDSHKADSTDDKPNIIPASSASDKPVALPSMLKKQ